MWKRIEAILRPYNIQELANKLSQWDVVFYFEECKGFGKRLSPLSLYQKDKGASIESLPRTKLTLYVKNETVVKLINLILSIGSTGIIGDGKIFIEPVIKIVDFESGEIYA